MIKIGPAGSGGLGNIRGLQEVAKMKLDCMEVEFTYGVRMSMEAARAMGDRAKEKGILLSVHAPYYINLASDDPEKRIASRKRILDSCERADALGARNVVFHAGFYQGKPASLTFEIICQALLDIQGEIENNGWDVLLCPEITGKPSQFGSLEEILTLMKETGCGITVDFAHLYARRQGRIDYVRVLSVLPPAFHAHFSGISFGEKGEIKHLPMTKKAFRPLAVELVKANADVTIICESPKPYEDAEKMGQVIQELHSS